MDVVFPSEADSFMIGDEGLPPPSPPSPGPKRNGLEETVSLQTHLLVCAFTSQKLTALLLKAFLAVLSKKKKSSWHKCGAERFH